MKELIIQNLSSLGTGFVVGLIFAFLRLPVPAPNVLAGVMGIFGITLGYLLFVHFFGK